MTAKEAAPREFTPAAEANTDDAVGTKVKIRGWIHRTRSSGGIVFIVMKDASGLIQVTGKLDALGEPAFELAAKALVESALIVEGTVAKDPRAPGGHEVRAQSIQILHLAEVFPIWSGQTEEFLLDKRHLAIRSQEMVATFRVKTEALRAARSYLDSAGFWEMTPPLLTGNAAEGGSEAFTLDYFGTPAYLSQTAQLYLEALIYPLERVYSFTTSFRAEKSRTPRHLTEFTHLEAELAWADNLTNMGVQEGLVETILHTVAEKRAGDLKLLGRDPAELLAIKAPFEKIRYAEALELLKAKGFNLTFGADLGTAEERALTQERTQPIFVTNYPREIKAFYMLQSESDPRTVECADLLAPEGFGEIIGGSCREVVTSRLEERLAAIGARREDYAWYLDLRRYGSVPHAGFGLGFERIIRWIGRREHIRDTTPFPRTPSRLLP